MTYEQLLKTLGLDAKGLDSTRIEALQILASGEVPAHVVKERKARAGKMLKYYSHKWARRLLRDALGMGYALETLETEYHPGPSGGVEGSVATARVRLTVYTKDGCAIATEPGVFDNTQKYNPSSARASAASRGVCRCMMQLFGLGAEWYGDDEEVVMSASAAWASIKAQAAALGLEEEAVKTELQAKFDSKDLGRRYAEAMQAVQDMADSKVLAKPAAEEIEELDKLLEVAEGLGAEISHKEADMAVAIEDNAIASDVLAEAVAEVGNWGEFYALLEQTMGYPNGTAVQKDVNAIFGPARPQKDGHPDWEKIYNALREWKGATNDTERDAVTQKYK